MVKNIMNKRLTGTGVALVTPFTQSGDVDYESLERIVENVITSGVDFLVVFGTTGETPTLNDEEKYEMLWAIYRYGISLSDYVKESAK